MSQASNKKLCEEFSDGMALGDNHMEEIDEVLRRYSDGNVHNLFSTDKVYPKPKDYQIFCTAVETHIVLHLRQAMHLGYFPTITRCAMKNLLDVLNALRY